MKFSLYTELLPVPTFNDKSKRDIDFVQDSIQNLFNPTNTLYIKRPFFTLIHGSLICFDFRACLCSPKKTRRGGQQHIIRDKKSPILKE